MEGETFDLIVAIWKETKGVGTLLLGAYIFWRFRKSIGKNVREYVDKFKDELIEADKASMSEMKKEFKEEVSKSLEEQLRIIKTLIDSNQKMNTKVLDAIGQSINALNMQTEELVIIIQRQGWAEESITKIKKALEQANIKIEGIQDITDHLK